MHMTHDRLTQYCVQLKGKYMLLYAPVHAVDKTGDPCQHSTAVNSEHGELPCLKLESLLIFALPY